IATIRTRSEQLANRLWVIPIGPNVGIPERALADRAEARRWLGVGPEDFVLIYFGFVHPVKGVETLIRAVRVARAQRPAVKLWIVGGVESLALRGGEAAAYERSIRSLITDEAGADAIDLTSFLPDGEVARRLA